MRGARAKIIRAATTRAMQGVRNDPGCPGIVSWWYPSGVTRTVQQGRASTARRMYRAMKRTWARNRVAA